jgi:hypothetical protein
MNTIFEIKSVYHGRSESTTIEVEGVGQQTCSAILKANKGKVIILQGFYNPITNEFIKSNF